MLQTIIFYVIYLIDPAPSSYLRRGSWSSGVFFKKHLYPQQLIVKLFLIQSETVLIAICLSGFLQLKTSCVLEGSLLFFLVSKYLFSVCTLHHCLSGEYIYTVKEGGSFPFLQLLCSNLLKWNVILSPVLSVNLIFRWCIADALDYVARAKSIHKFKQSCICFTPF